MRDPNEFRRSSWPIAGEDALRLWDAPPLDAQPLMIGALPCGVQWQDELGRYCLLVDVSPWPSKGSRAVQTSMVLEQIEALLDRVGLGFGDVIRTWFFLEDINGWYGEFNRVRTRFFSERGLLGRAPASTAVGVANDRHGALKAHVLAFRPHDASSSVSVAHSPLQGAAFDYGSAFSRAILVRWATGKRLYVSGTASIDAVGRTLHPDNPAGQVKEVLRVIGSMLEYHGLGFSDARLATAYFPRSVDEAMVRREWAQRLTLPFSHLDVEICRPDLCFEIELTAERATC